MRLRRGLLSDALPDRRSFLLVFGTAAFLTYTWTLLVSFWNFPSWAFFLTAFQIASIYAYAFLVNFLESVFLTSLAILLRWLLPGRWWKEDFVPLSVMSMPGFVIAINAGYRLYATTSPPGFPLTLQIIFILSVISVLLGLAFTVHKVGLLKRAAMNFADRAVIFLYMYLPFTALGLVLIAVRTIISPA